MSARLPMAASRLGALAAMRLSGEVRDLAGFSVRVAGLDRLVAAGDRLLLHARDGREVPAEVVGFRDALLFAAALAPTEGLGPGCRAEVAAALEDIAPTDDWLGRVFDPLGAPLDGQPAPPRGVVGRPMRNAPPPATRRARLGPVVSVGVRALDLFAPCRAGQRLGLFAGSGIGKSTLLGMLARGTDCDVVVLALVGERGREVRDFVEDELGPGARARSVVIAATSDTAPALRRACPEAAMAVAEHFRDAGRHVLLLIDSVTRYCMALREIGLAAGEPPATRGYPPSVFADLPRLLERAGPGVPPPEGREVGTITAIVTVLVEGDDHNEPVADAVRGILDGHVVLDRRIAESGRYPAIDVLRSLSRAGPAALMPDDAALARRARALLARHAEMADLARLGAYQGGTDPATDEALRIGPAIEALLAQRPDELDREPFAALGRILGPPAYD